MEQATERVGGRFAERPRVEAKIRQVIGTTLTSHGAFDAAERELDAAVRLWARLRTPADPELLHALNALGEAYYFQGRLADSIRAFERIVAATDDAPVDAGTPRVEALANLAFMEMRSGAFDRAEARYHDAIVAASALPDGERDETTTLIIRGNLASLYTYMERIADAERVYRDVIERAKVVYGAEHSETAQFIANLASMLMRSGRVEEAIPSLRESLAIQEAVLGSTHAKTLVTLNNVAEALLRVGRLGDATTIVDDGIDRAVEAYGEDDRTTLFLRYTKAKIERAAGRHDAAEAQLIASLAAHRRVHGVLALDAYHVYETLILFYLDTRPDPAAALTASRAMLADLEALGREHDYNLMGRTLEMRALLALERYDEAESSLRAYRDVAPEKHHQSIDARLDEVARARRP